MVFSKPILSLSFLLFSLLGSVTNAYFAITGPTGGIHPRLEIRQLYHATNQWNLYLLALVQFQGNQQDYITSWFQIGGIHGSPNVEWDGVAATGNSGAGYCTHGSNLFPIWHRPYIALFEQKLQQAAVFIAGTFSGSDRTMYQNLASTLRAPYYDWAAAPANGNAFPLVLSQKYVTVTYPGGPQTIINPLFRYNFHPGPNPSPYGTPWTTWDATLRYPTSTASNAVSQNDQVETTMANNRVGQRQSLYNWFTLCPNYDQISNDQSSSSSTSCHISLESLHNNVHVWVGGGNDGHMTIVPVSAHDPSFMLHHVMIDRLFAMWQTLYPNSYITNEASQISTFTINVGDIEGPNSNLTPFHKNTAGDFWTPTNSRSLSPFGYTYPEYADSDGSAASIRGYINKLYGPNASGTAGSSKKRDLGSFVESTIANATASATGPLASGDVLDGIAALPVEVTTATNGSTYQYIANVKTTRWQLGQSYSIYMFFGNPASETPSTWYADPAFVGSYGVFSGPGMQNSKATSTSTIPLTDALIKSVSAGALETLEQLFVIPFLQKNLVWRIATTSGTEIQPSAVPDFLISVVSSTMTVPASDTEFPVWSKFHVLTQITSEKSGGASSVEQAVSSVGKK